MVTWTSGFKGNLFFFLFSFTLTQKTISLHWNDWQITRHIYELLALCTPLVQSRPCDHFQRLKSAQKAAAKLQGPQEIIFHGFYLLENHNENRIAVVVSPLSLTMVRSLQFFLLLLAMLFVELATSGQPQHDCEETRCSDMMFLQFNSPSNSKATISNLFIMAILGSAFLNKW